MSVCKKSVPAPRRRPPPNIVLFDARPHRESPTRIATFPLDTMLPPLFLKLLIDKKRRGVVRHVARNESDLLPSGAPFGAKLAVTEFLEKKLQDDVKLPLSGDIVITMI